MTDTHSRAASIADDDATAEVLADTDALGEFLAEELCYGKPAYISREMAASGDPLDMTTPQLVALAIQWPSLAVHALMELRDRYLRDQAGRIAALAGEKLPAIEEELRMPEEA